MHFSPFLLILFFSINHSFGQKIATNYAKMEVSFGGKSSDICVVAQKYIGGSELPEDRTKSQPFHITWWDFQYGKTAICQPPRAPNRFSPRDLVPLSYWTHPEQLEQACSISLHSRPPIDYQKSLANSAGVRAYLYLLDKGAINANDTHDYLHSEFCNSESVVDGMDNHSIFYIYRHDFEQFISPKLQDLLHSDSVEIRFYRPIEYFDFSIFSMWLLILLSVALGSLWSAKAAHMRLERKSTVRRSGESREAAASVELEECQTSDGGAKEGVGSATAEEGGASAGGLLHSLFCCAVSVTLVIAVIISIERFLSILWAVFAVVPLAKSLFAICKYILFPHQRGEQRILFTFKKIRLTPVGIICYGISIAICAVWFFFKHHPLAFLLLNFINVAICAFFIKYLTFERLKRHLELRAEFIWSTSIIAFGIIVLIFSFFSRKQYCSPTPPIDSGLTVVGAFFVPIFDDPLSDCWDVGVELGYRHFAVPLFFIIFSAFFLPYWFYIDFLNGHKTFPYSIVAFSAYALLLLLLLFPSLFLRAHLPLIFLMPIPTYAGSLFALSRGTFGKLWKGQLTL